MAILIDPPAWPAHGTLWSHLVSDSDYAELHAFAARLRIPRRGFDLDHYDLPASRYAEAVALGAIPVGAKDVVHRLRDSGLRVRQADRAAVTPVRRRQYLIAEWAALGDALEFGSVSGSGRPGTGGTRGIGGTVGDAEEWHRLGEGLILRWNEPHRSYHDERHLEDVLLALDQLATRGERIAPATLLAAWFHDAVYTGAGGAASSGISDELESARLAAAALGGVGLDASLTALVGDMIVATTPAGMVQDPTPRTASPAASAHLLDADLSIFAAPRHRYAEYSTAVRAEYAHVADADFATGRAQILDAYLSRPEIYATGAARRLWEDRARANVAREIADLWASTASDAAVRDPD